MGLFGCLKPPATEETTTVRAGDGQTYSGDASVNAYTPPTEHQLPWSHTAHPPSVASSILLDPEGQAFAKHYNPLLSQDTSQESPNSSNQHQDVLARRFDEQSQDSHPSSPQVSTAATRQARPVADTVATWKLGSNGPDTDGTLHIQQITDKDAKLQQEQADVITRKQNNLAITRMQNNLAAASTAEMPTSSLTRKSGSQQKLGNQIALALQRHGKGVQLSQKAAPATPAPADQAQALLPERAALSQNVAQIEGDEHSNKLAIFNDSPVSALVPASNLASTGSRMLCQPQPAKAEGLHCSAPSAAAVLPSMTAGAASYCAGTKHAETPAPPIPSIDRCSSASSWGASTAPSSALQSHLTDSAVTAVSADPLTSVRASDQHSSGLTDSSVKQQVHSPTVCTKHNSKQIVLERPSNADAIQAMHDNSSSWRKQRDLTKGSANSSCRASVSTKQAALKAAARQKQAKVTEFNMAVANKAGQQKQAAVIRASTPAETLEGPEVSPPSQAWPLACPAGKAKDAKKQREGLEKTTPAATQENVTPNADPSPLPPVAPSLSKTDSQPQQTLEAMAAWLDAQLAKASGSQHGQGTAIIANTAPPAPASRSQAGSKPKGLPVPRGLSRPGATQVKRIQRQNQDKPSQSSARAGESKGQSMSVSEMMQWLDSTLAQPAVSPQPARQAACLRMNTSHCSDMPDDPAHPSRPASAQATASEEPAANQTMKGNIVPRLSPICSHAPACHASTTAVISSQAGAAVCGQEQLGAASATASIDLSRPSVNSTAELLHLAHPANESESHEQQSCPSARPPKHPAHGSDTSAASATPDAQLSQASIVDTIQQHSLAVSAAVQGVPQAKTAALVPSSIRQPADVVTSAASINKQHSMAPASPAAAQQSAAQMLQWLDATLAAKKPAACQQQSQAAACQAEATSKPAAPVMSAGPEEMLAWLDAKIAGAKTTATPV